MAPTWKLQERIQCMYPSSSLSLSGTPLPLTLPDMTFTVDWALRTNYLSILYLPLTLPDMTFTVDWALKTNYLSILYLPLTLLDMTFTVDWALKNNYLSILYLPLTSWWHPHGNCRNAFSVCTRLGCLCVVAPHPSSSYTTQHHLSAEIIMTNHNRTGNIQEKK